MKDGLASKYSATTATIVKPRTRIKKVSSSTLELSAIASKVFVEGGIRITRRWIDESP